jgi:hypothetical protein
VREERALQAGLSARRDRRPPVVVRDGNLLNGASGEATTTY